MTDTLPVGAACDHVGAGLCWADSDVSRPYSTGRTLLPCEEPAETELGLCPRHQQLIVGCT